jgi:hypothetical protein
MADDGVRIEHPNRGKASSKATAIAGPAWFERDKTGFNDPALDSSLLGLITLLIVPVQALLIAFSMQGFAQEWNVEVERRTDPPTDALPAAG